MDAQSQTLGSNNTNKLSPQEPLFYKSSELWGSNNTNKLSPQERQMVRARAT